MLHFSSSLSLSLSFAPLRYPLAIASPFVFNISPGRWGALARDKPSTATFSALQHSFFVVFFSLFFCCRYNFISLSLSAAIHPSLPIFHFLFLFSWTHSDHLHYFSHPFGIRPVPARASNKSYSVFMYVARAPVCVWVCVSVSIKVDVYAHTIILEVLIKTNH